MNFSSALNAHPRYVKVNAMFRGKILMPTKILPSETVVAPKATYGFSLTVYEKQKR